MLNSFVKPAAAIGLVLATLSARAGGYEPDLKTSLVTFPLPGTNLRGIGRMQVPTDLRQAADPLAAPLPAVVIVHGTGGMDAKGPMYARELNRVGIATLEIDLWSPRNLAGGWDGRPKHVKENLPDAFGALAYLAADPRIDPQRIGMGFSWGGVLTLLSADRGYAADLLPDGPRFAAHVAFYPICFVYNRIPGYRFVDTTGAPVLILTGAQDKYDADPQACPKLVDGLDPAIRATVRVKVYPGAEHGFNNLDRPRTYFDPYHFQGRGGMGTSAPQPEAREDSIRETVRFFTARLMHPQH